MVFEQNYSSAGPQIKGDMCNIFNATNLCCHVQPSQGVFYGVLFLLGFIINAAALRAFIAKRNSWTDTHIYMLNLNIADFSLILFLVFRVWDAFSCLPKNDFCTFLIYVHFINMYASIFTTVAISIQRFFTLKFPLHARSWKRKKEIAFAVCLAIWVFLVTVCVVFRDQNSPGKLWTCFERCKNIPLRPTLVTLLVLVGFFIPLLIVVFCSSQIICMFLKELDKSGEKKNIVGIVTANMIVFIICYTPIHIAFINDFFDEPPADWWLATTDFPSHKYLLVSEWIGATNCCFDCISYYFLLKDFYLKTSVSKDSS